MGVPGFGGRVAQAGTCICSTKRVSYLYERTPMTFNQLTGRAAFWIAMWIFYNVGDSSDTADTPNVFGDSSGLKLFETPITCLLHSKVNIVQYWFLLNWQNLQLHCGCVAVPVNWFFDIISSFFAKFKNAVQSLKPGETPSNSAFHQAPNYVQRC